MRVHRSVGTRANAERPAERTGQECGGERERAAGEHQRFVWTAVCSISSAVVIAFEFASYAR
ncbi:MAG TPA: hypothetical protein VK669_03960, partial [Candidatus Limnocylindrales bacterium]|nr:hypothetical protein [Candidatus Limnocylindrales bacterium]